MTLAGLLHLPVQVRPPVAAPDALPAVRDADYVYAETPGWSPVVHRIVPGQCPPLPHIAPWHTFTLLNVGGAVGRGTALTWCQVCWPEQVSLCLACRRPSGGHDECPDCLERSLDVDKRIERAA